MGSITVPANVLKMLTKRMAGVYISLEQFVFSKYIFSSLAVLSKTSNSLSILHITKGARENFSL